LIRGKELLPFSQLLLLSLIQGLTEFIPVSSSAHLAILPNIMHWHDQGLMMDVAVHFGTLFSVILYFRKDVAKMFMGALDLVRFQDTSDRKLFLQLSLATIPLVIAGFLVTMLFGDARQLEIMAWTSIGFGLLLYIIDKRIPATKNLDQMNYKSAFVIGLGQSLAVIPGTSRAGSSMTTLRALGYSRVDTARFSCFLSIPAVLAASTFMGYKLTKIEHVEIYNDVLLAAALSFVAGYISIDFMMRWVQKSTYTVFVAYRVCLGILLLLWIYWR
jgi:undecaprenyl-diphosphatase